MSAPKPAVDSRYRYIVAIAVPVVLANLAMPLQSVIDTAIVGHMPEAANLAGMGLAIQLLTLLLVSFNFLQYASSGLSAQALGNATREKSTHDNVSRDNKATNTETLATNSASTTKPTKPLTPHQLAAPKLLSILQRALLIALAIGAVLLLLKPWVIDVGLQLLAANPASGEAAKTYLDVRLWGVMAELMNFAFIGWFAGQGRTRYLLYQQSAIAALNIILTLSLVYGANMGLAGVALGTTIAYWIGFIIAMYLVKGHLQISLRELFTLDRREFTRDKMLRLFLLNKDIFIRTIVLTISFAWITRLSAMSGDLVLAANTILLQVLTISALALDGVAVAAETLSGQAAGRRDWEQFRIIIKRTGIVSYGLAAVLTMIWWLGMPYYLPMMTDLPDVIALAFDYRWYAILLPVIGVGAYWLDGVFFGLTAGHVIRNAALILAVIFFPLSLLLYGQFGMHGIWLSVCSLLLIRLFILGIYLTRITLADQPEQII
jgi:MATE family multidrug resistance protein